MQEASASLYRELFGSEAAADVHQSLWRRCSDSGYLRLLNRLLEPTDWPLLKTALWIAKTF